MADKPLSEMTERELDVYLKSCNRNKTMSMAKEAKLLKTRLATPKFATKR